MITGTTATVTVSENLTLFRSPDSFFSETVCCPDRIELVIDGDVVIIEMLSLTRLEVLEIVPDDFLIVKWLLFCPDGGIWASIIGC